jgi:hypothetical protein
VRISALCQVVFKPLPQPQRSGKARVKADNLTAPSENEGAGQFWLWHSIGWALALKRIAHRYGLTQQALIENWYLPKTSASLMEFPVIMPNRINISESIHWLAKTLMGATPHSDVNLKVAS